MKPVRGNLSPIFIFVLIVHVISLLLRVSFEPKAPPEVTEDRPIKVKLLDTEKRRQIVRSEDSEDKTPKDDAYLSDKDRSFDRQSKARKIDTFKQAAKGGAPSKAKKELSFSDLAAHSDPNEKDPFRTAAKEYAKKKNGQATPSTNPNATVSSTNDHVEEIPLGDVTHLNTVEYKYYGFYFRIRQRLEQFWGKSIQEKAEAMVRQGRRIASDDQHVTALQITLDHEGRIVGISIRGSSGVKELDDAAIESFNQAGPFPNPPRDLVKNGRVTLEWGFVVQT